jgi:hypothetical protein
MQNQGENSGAKTISALISLVIFGGSLWWYFGGGIENKVASDAVAQYNIAKEKGNAMDACVSAGIVAAAYQQAKDSDNYGKWKDIERADCKQAGVPQ